MALPSQVLSVLDALSGRVRAAGGWLGARPKLQACSGWLAMGLLMLAHGVLLAGLGGSVVAPYLVQKYLRGEASRALGREISLASLSFNPFTFDIKAAGLRVMEKDGGEQLAGFSRFELNLDPSDLIERRLTVTRFLLEAPALRLARDAQGRFNLSDLIPEGPSSREQGPLTLDLVPAGIRFSLANVLFTGGRVVFDDAVTGTRHEVTDLHFAIDSLSSDQPGLREIFNTGGQFNESSMTLTVKADLTGDNPEAEARLSVKDVVFRHYTPYLLPLKRPLDLRVNEAGLRVRMALPRKGAAGQPLVEGDAKVSGVSLRNGDETVAELGSLEVQGGTLDPATGAVSLERVLAQSPMARIKRDEAGVVELLALLEETPAERTGQAGPVPPLRIGEARLKDGRLDYEDEGLGVALPLANIEARLKGLDTASASLESLSVEGSSDHFKRLTLTAKGSYRPAGLQGTAVMEGADLGKPFPLLKRLLPRLGFSGVAGYDLAYTVGEKDGRIAPAVKGSLEIRDFKAMAEGQAKPLLSAGSVALAGVAVDVDARKASVGQVRISGGGASLARGDKGAFPALEAFPAGSGPSGQAGGAWAFTLDSCQLAGFALEFSDSLAKLEQRADIESLEVKNVSSGLEKPLGITAKGSLGSGEGKAAFEVGGEVRLKEMAAALTVNLTGLPLAELSRLAPSLPVAVLSGRAGLNGQAALSFGGSSTVGSFTGDAAVTELKLARPGSTDPWASLAGLTVKGAQVTLSPMAFKAAGVTLSDPWLGLSLDKDGRPVLPLDLAPEGGKVGQSAALPPEGGKQGKQDDPAPKIGRQASPANKTPGASEAKPGGLPLVYGVDKAEIRGGRIDLTAQGFEPQLTARIADIAVTVTGIAPERPAAVAMSFSMGRSGRFQAEGQAGWVAGAPLLDLRATLENFDLGELSPVSQKFTGFPVNRGKLNLKLEYKAGAKSLDLRNKIVAMGIQLGRRTAQPGGKDIPLDLAVSLLSDAKGVIDLDIPVKGDPAHAKADLHDVISTAMAGAFARILFSPLAFLNVAKGGGRTAGVGFAPGTAELTPEGRKVLTDLSAALAKRPSLKLEIMAYADQASEADALAGALAAKAQAASAAAPVVPPAAKPSRGRAAKEAPPAEAAPAAPAPKPLSAEDWGNLARARLEAVRLFLTSQGGLPDSRIFLMSGDFMHPPKMEGVPPTRVDVTLAN